MRCYFMRNGHIAAVEVLTVGISDTDAVETGKALFREREAANRYEGFEVWDRARRIHCHPPNDTLQV
jgi:predicted protein tyrosine phosphatase